MSDAGRVPIEDLLAHREWVRSLAREMVFDGNRADDLEQQVWLEALQHPPRNRSSLRGWFRRVVQSRARDAWRAEGRRTARESLPREAAAQPTPVEVVARAEAHRRVVEVVLRLDEPYRATVLLRFFEDLPPREVARRMGCPEDTVRTRLRRALERLRRELDGGRDGERPVWAIALGLPMPRVPMGGGPAPAGAVLGLAGGGILMAKWISAACASAAVLGVLVFLLRSDGEAAGPAPPHSTARATPRGGPGRGAPPAAAAAGTPPVESAPPAPLPAALPPLADLGTTRRVVFRNIAGGDPAAGLVLSVEFVPEGGGPAARAEVAADGAGAADLPARDRTRSVETKDPAWMLLSDLRGEEGWVCRTREVSGVVRSGTPGALDPLLAEVRAVPAFTILGSRPEPADPWNSTWAARHGVLRAVPLGRPGPDGVFRGRVPALADLYLHAAAPGWLPACVRVPGDAPSGGPPVDLVLEGRLPRLSLSVVDADGSPVRDAEVQVFATTILRPEDVEAFMARYGTVNGLTMTQRSDRAAVNLNTWGRTAADGTLSVDMAIPGEILIAVSPVEGHGPMVRKLGRLDTDLDGLRIEMVRVDPAARIRITADGTPLPGFGGFLADLSSGEAQPAFPVTLDAESGLPAGYLREGGEYAIIFGPWGSHRFRAPVKGDVLDLPDLQNEVRLTDLLKKSREARGGGGGGGGEGR